MSDDAKKKSSSPGKKNVYLNRGVAAFLPRCVGHRTSSAGGAPAPLLMAARSGGDGSGDDDALHRDDDVETLLQKAQAELETLVDPKSAAEAVALLRYWQNKGKEQEGIAVPKEKYYALPPESSKEKRRAIHKLVRQSLSLSPFAVADTDDTTEDKRVRIWHRAFQKDMPSYGLYAEDHRQQGRNYNNKGRAAAQEKKKKRGRKGGAENNDGHGGGKGGVGGGGRPLNSYLKVVLDDVSLNILHFMSLAIRDATNNRFSNDDNKQQEQQQDEGGKMAVADAAGSNQADASTTTTTGKNNGDNVDEPFWGSTNNASASNNIDPSSSPSSTKRTRKQQQRQRRSRRRPLSYKPRSRQSLHMTFFFGGKVLCALPANELNDWHRQLVKRLLPEGTSSKVLPMPEAVEERGGGVDKDDARAGGDGDRRNNNEKEEGRDEGTVAAVPIDTSSSNISGSEAPPPSPCPSAAAGTISGETDSSAMVVDAIHYDNADASSVVDERGNEAAAPPVPVVVEPILGQNTDDVSQYTLTFRNLTLFPPRRNNLIVAIFDASDALHTLHGDLRRIALEETDSTLLHSVVLNRSKGRLVAHVTMGNLFGGTKTDLRELEDMLENGLGVKDALLLLDDDDGDGGAAGVAFRAEVRGLTMGGPVPDQVPQLDWDFSFHDPGD